MTEQPRTRQELYDRIRNSSKQEFILEEMLRLGFWATTASSSRGKSNKKPNKGEKENAWNA